MSAVDLRAARDRLTRAAYAVACHDQGAAHEHEQAAIAFVRATDTLEAVARSSARAEANLLGACAYSAEQIAAAEALGKAATEKCLKAVREISTLRAHTLNRATLYFLASGVPLADLRLEIEGDETRLMQSGTCVARVWLEYDMHNYKVMHHYEGPAL